jgi:hypothetical protein
VPESLPLLLLLAPGLRVAVGELLKDVLEEKDGEAASV